MKALNTLRNAAVVGLALAGVSISSLALSADVATRQGRDTVYAAQLPAPTAAKPGKVTRIDQVFGRAGGISLMQKLAAKPSRDVRAGADVMQRFGRA